MKTTEGYDKKVGYPGSIGRRHSGFWKTGPLTFSGGTSMYSDVLMDFA